MRVYCPSRKEMMETAADPLTPGGAEGSVYSIPGEDVVAKIFSDPSGDHRREKVEALIARPFHDAGRARFAAPREILRDPASGGFFGYTMTHILNSASLDEFFDPQGSRYREDQLMFRVKLAIAVAEAIVEVHRHSLHIILGDLKPQNILADDLGRVALIDLDSVQLTTPRGETYLCPVRSEFYTAPELYDKDLRLQRREPSSDLFALAVIIFQLLMGGWHPFAAAGQAQLVAQIRRGGFPYVPGAADRPPPGAPPFSSLPIAIQHLFIQAFVDGHFDPRERPAADVWVKALKANLKACARRRASTPMTTAPATKIMRPAVGCPTATAAALWPTIRRTLAVAAAIAGIAILSSYFSAAGQVSSLAGLPSQSEAFGATPHPLSADLLFPPRDLDRGIETPAYWRRLRDGGGPALSFEPSESPDVRSNP